MDRTPEVKKEEPRICDNCGKPLSPNCCLIGNIQLRTEELRINDSLRGSAERPGEKI